MGYPIRNPEKPSRPAFADWQAQLRMALFESVTPDDIRDVVENLKEKAKKGDHRAIDLLFRYAFGGAQVTVKNAVIVQDGGGLKPLPTSPAKVLPGTESKLEILSQRAKDGKTLYDPRDAKRNEE